MTNKCRNRYVQWMSRRKTISEVNQYEFKDISGTLQFWRVDQETLDTQYCAHRYITVIIPQITHPRETPITLRWDRDVGRLMQDHDSDDIIKIYLHISKGMSLLLQLSIRISWFDSSALCQPVLKSQLLVTHALCLYIWEFSVPNISLNLLLWYRLWLWYYYQNETVVPNTHPRALTAPYVERQPYSGRQLAYLSPNMVDNSRPNYRFFLETEARWRAINVEAPVQDHDSLNTSFPVSLIWLSFKYINNIARMQRSQ